MDPSSRVAASAASIIDGDSQGTTRPRIELTLADIDLDSSDNEADVPTSGGLAGKGGQRESPAQKGGGNYKWGSVSDGGPEGAKIVWGERKQDGERNTEPKIASLASHQNGGVDTVASEVSASKQMDQNQRGGVYRAALRAVFAAQEESAKPIEECYAAAEFLRRAFGFDTRTHQEAVVEVQNELSFRIPG